MFSLTSIAENCRVQASLTSGCTMPKVPTCCPLHSTLACRPGKRLGSLLGSQEYEPPNLASRALSLPACMWQNHAHVIVFASLNIPTCACMEDLIGANRTGIRRRIHVAFKSKQTNHLHTHTKHRHHVCQAVVLNAQP